MRRFPVREIGASESWRRYGNAPAGKKRKDDGMHDARTGVCTGALVAGMALLMAGCSTPGPMASKDVGGNEDAVMCSKCRTVWVQRPQHTGKSAVVYRREEQMVCPECQSAVVTFFKTGKLDHTCAACVGTLDHCKVHGEAAHAATNAPAAAIHQEAAAMCSKCKMVWVRRPHQTGKATVYRSEQAMQCPDCKSAAANFFTTGKWQHTCTACGDNLSTTVSGFGLFPAHGAP